MGELAVAGEEHRDRFGDKLSELVGRTPSSANGRIGQKALYVLKHLRVG